MKCKIQLTTEAKLALGKLKDLDPKKHKKVLKTLGLMEANLRHQSLNTHKYKGYSGPNGEEAFESYVENKTPGAYRVFWYYGPDQGVVTILAITPHP